MPDVLSRDNPVTDHEADHCELEMGQCVGGCRPSCPLFGYCMSDSHTGPTKPDWPCATALRALGETRAEWVEKHDADLDAWVEFEEAQMRSWSTDEWERL